MLLSQTGILPASHAIAYGDLLAALTAFKA
jgi:hypothetical protein